MSKLNKKKEVQFGQMKLYLVNQLIGLAKGGMSNMT